MQTWGRRSGYRMGDLAARVRVACVHTASLPAMLAVAVFALAGCGGKDSTTEQARGTPGGETVPLNAALQPLREDFEAAYGKYRLVAVLSPSCSHCMEHARNLVENGLDPLVQDGVQVFFVWSTIMPSDTLPRARKANTEVFHPAVRSYYDESGKVTRAFGRMLGLGTGVDAYDLFCLYGPEATWDPEGTMEDEPADFNVARALWAPTRAALMLGDPERHRTDIQPFWVKDLLAGYEEMKAVN